MNTAGTLDRKEPTERLPALGNALADVFQRSDLDSARLHEIATNGIKGECPLCRMTINGHDLLSVALEKSEAGPLSARVDRLRNGYCPRNGCDSRFYDLSFESTGDFDWSAILAAASARRSPTSATDDDIALTVAETKARFRRLIWTRIVLPLGLLAAALIFRQWYRGGSIPFVREPEAFQVDPLPPGQHDWSQGPPAEFKD